MARPAQATDDGQRIVAGARIGLCTAGEQQWTVTASGPPDPGVLAEHVVAEMHLPTPVVAANLPSTDVDPDSYGVIGLPIWLATTDRALATTQGRTHTRTVADRGLSLTLTARLDRLDFTLAPTPEWLAKHPTTPTRTLACTGNTLAGTPYVSTPAHTRHVPDSPTCGFPADQITHAGHYTLTTTATYTITYTTNTSQPATFTHTPTPTTHPYTLKELQTIIIK